MLPLGDVIRRYGIHFYSYADDTQLYIAMSPDDTRPIDALFNHILEFKLWMAENFLQLNQDKAEVLVIGPEEREPPVKITGPVTKVNGSSKKPGSYPRLSAYFYPTRLACCKNCFFII